MEDVRKAKDYRSDDQTRPRILERSREQILQQSTEQKFLRPRSEEQHAKYGQR